MDYYNTIQKTINYIEENLGNDISLSEISQIAGFSLYHFHRLFPAMVGCSLKEYIRKRRLTHGAYLLLFSESSILDIALDCQYNTHESFSRAFKKEFNSNPNEFRKNKQLLNLFGKINLLQYKLNKGEQFMKPQIVTHNEFIVIGVELKTTISNNEGFKVIPEFWKKYYEYKRADLIPNKTEAKQCYGICTNFDNDNFSYIIGEEVSSLEEVPEGYTGLTIPKAQYAVFTVKGKMPEAIQDAAQKIYGTWFPQSGYERASTPDFELYDSRMDNDPPEMDIYIPIK